MRNIPHPKIKNHILSEDEDPELKHIEESYFSDFDDSPHHKIDYDYINRVKAKKSPGPVRTTKEIAASLIEKAENILPESKQRKINRHKAEELRKKETLEERIDREKKYKRSEINKKIRIAATKQRRDEFNLKRPELILKMLAADVLYECVVEGCENKDITIDHITPLSLGGTDDLENLQFMCLSHNSQKGIKKDPD